MPSQTPFPLMPPKSTELRMEHFDDTVYNLDRSTRLFRFIDALCGDAGAGSLKKEIFLQRLSGALDGIYGTDLDYIFGNVKFLARTSSEAYPHDPMTQQLTSPTWDEIAAKDAAYRSRIKEFFQACNKGNTIDGIRMAVHAAISADCTVMENWRYIDNFGLNTGVGRTGMPTVWAAVQTSTGFRRYFDSEAEAQDLVNAKGTGWAVHQVRARSEVTVVPHKANMTAREARLLRQMLDKITSQDVVITVDSVGINVNYPIKIQAITADSTYYQVEKVVTGTPVLADLPAPEMLAIDLDPSESWLKANTPELAPYGQFNITQEYGYYYLVSGGKRSPIDNVTYGTLQADGTQQAESAFEWYEEVEQFGPWTDYGRGDSPDNYPGGKYGLTPASTPALNPDRSPYVFPYQSQADYVAKRKAEVLALGGEANDLRYRTVMLQSKVSKRTYNAEMAIAYTAPASESTVTSSWTSRKPRYLSADQRGQSMFVK